MFKCHQYRKPYISEEQKLGLDKAGFFEKIQETYEELKERLADNGFDTVPRPIKNNFGGNFESEKTKYDNEEL